MCNQPRSERTQKSANLCLKRMRRPALSRRSRLTLPPSIGPTLPRELCPLPVLRSAASVPGTVRQAMGLRIDHAYSCNAVDLSPQFAAVCGNRGENGAGSAPVFAGICRYLPVFAGICRIVRKAARDRSLPSLRGANPRPGAQAACCTLVALLLLSSRHQFVAAMMLCFHRHCGFISFCCHSRAPKRQPAEAGAGCVNHPSTDDTFGRLCGKDFSGSRRTSVRRRLSPWQRHPGSEGAVASAYRASSIRRFGSVAISGT